VVKKKDPPPAPDPNLPVVKKKDPPPAKDKNSH
jgi:hypothetical protein